MFVGAEPSFLFPSKASPKGLKPGVQRAKSGDGVGEGNI